MSFGHVDLVYERQKKKCCRTEEVPLYSRRKVENGARRFIVAMGHQMGMGVYMGKAAGERSASHEYSHMVVGVLLRQNILYD